jgi:ring-1,2-phenylacetyl-CoA epoxidase subunit PaaD
VVKADRVAQAWGVLATVLDPEVPALSLVDLGVVREVHEQAQGLTVVLTPTYSGCPAIEAIESAARDALESAGLGTVAIEQRLAPAWTTDWISEAGREKLLAYGIAPPAHLQGQAAPLRFHPRGIHCPRCGSAQTERLSAFGSTACKALYRCLACREPFEHFKPI